MSAADDPPPSAELDATGAAALLERAASGWLSNRDIVTILRDWQSLSLVPASGTLHLFDRRRVRAFRRDGHTWQKKGGSQTVREAHEKLKVGSETLINAYYCSREDAPRFQRRCYWLLQGDEGMVLVHYLDSGGGAAGAAGGGAAEAAVRPPRRAAAAAAAAAFAAAREAGRDASGDEGASGDEDAGSSDEDASDGSAGAAPQPQPRAALPPQQRAPAPSSDDPWDGLMLPWLDADTEAALAVVAAPPPPAPPQQRAAKRPAPEPRSWPGAAPQQAAPQQGAAPPQLPAKLLDYAPRGDGAAGGTRMLLVLAGGVVSGPIVALFDRVAVPTQWVAPGVLACMVPRRAAGGTVALALATPRVAPAGAPQPLLFAPLCAPVPFVYRDPVAAAPAPALHPFSPYAPPEQSAAAVAAFGLAPGAPLHHAAHAA